MATTEAKPRTRRIDELSLSKPVPNGFLEDRRSVYWGRHDSIVKDWDSGNTATVFAITPKLQTLIGPKKWNQNYVGDRPSPIWPVSAAARNASCPARVESLADAKSLHRDFRPEKSVYTMVTDAAKNCEANARMETLAKPKQYRELPIKPNSGWDWGEWESDIPEAAKKTEASDRVTLLARSKALHARYQEGKSTIWTVSAQSKKALPSLRLQQLARPKSRSQYKEDYDQSWYKVSPSAKLARANPRLVELCAPIPRKVRQKRVIVQTER